VKKSTGFYPRLTVDADGGSAVGQAGGVLLTSTVRAAGLYVELYRSLAPWRSPSATHDPAKVLLDLAMTLALGGDTCSDLAVVRAEPAIYGPEASDPTLSRMLARLADDADAALAAAHSEKQNAAPTFKRGFGFHPLCAFVDHGPEGTGEPVAVLLRAGNAGSNTAADHLQVISQSLAQIPGTTRGKSILVRIDGAGGSHKDIEALTRRRLAYSVGFTLPRNTPDLLGLIPEHVWAPAYDAVDHVRDGAWVAERTGLMDLSAWPTGMRVIVRKERPHPGAQLRFEDVDGMRITAFVTNST
jgi:Transposase DDE domain group 1